MLLGLGVRKGEHTTHTTHYKRSEPGSSWFQSRASGQPGQVSGHCPWAKKNRGSVAVLRRVFDRE